MATIFDPAFYWLRRMLREDAHGARADSDPYDTGQGDGTSTSDTVAIPFEPLRCEWSSASSWDNAETAGASSAVHKSAVWQTLVGGKTGLRFDLIWDSSVHHAPRAFISAVTDAAAYYTRMFSNNETIRVRIGYGEVDGKKIPANDVASSIGNSYYNFTYSNVYYYLTKDAHWSANQYTADSWLPSPSSAFNVYNDYYFRVTYAQAMAWGLREPGSAVDGYLGLSSSLDYDYDPKGAIGRNQYDAVGAIEHELSEIMGRVGSCLTLHSPSGADVFSPLDLFRYNPLTGYRETSAGLGYFSINGGHTELGLYNNPSVYGGDVADWNPKIIGDSYGSGSPGHRGYVSAVDLVEDSVLGFHLTADGLAATRTLISVV